MNIKNAIPSNKLRFVEFCNYGAKSASYNCNEWLEQNDVLILDYKAFCYGYQNGCYKIVLAYVENDKKNI